MPLSAIQNVYHRAFGFKETAHGKWVRVKHSSTPRTKLHVEMQKPPSKRGRRHQTLRFDGLRHHVHGEKQPFEVFETVCVDSNSVWEKF